MDQLFSVTQLAISIVTSFIAGILVVWYLKFRKKQINARIDELESDKEQLERIGKGSIELIRYGFRVLSFTVGLTSLCLSVLIFAYFLSDDNFIKAIVIWFAGVACAVAGFISMMFFNQLISLKDIKSAKEKLSTKQEKLREKLK
jgi:outer membrane murein-binding lipoprotein Lpp